MRKRLIGVAGLALTLTFLASGAGTIMPGASAASPAFAYTIGAGLDAGNLYRLAVPDLACDSQGVDIDDDVAETPNDTDTLQDENGADDATELDGELDEATDTDTDDVQCGDQNESDDDSPVATDSTFRASRLTTQIQTGVVASDDTEIETGVDASEDTEIETEVDSDDAIDGIQCDQEGEHEGDNVDC